MYGRMRPFMQVTLIVAEGNSRYTFEHEGVRDWNRSRDMSTLKLANGVEKGEEVGLLKVSGLSLRFKLIVSYLLTLWMLFEFPIPPAHLSHQEQLW